MPGVYHLRLEPVLSTGEPTADRRHHDAHTELDDRLEAHIALR